MILLSLGWTSKWRNYGVAFLLGILENFSYPPYNYFVFLPIALCLIYGMYIKYLKNDQYSYKSIFCLGFFYGLGKFTFAVYWFYYAFLVDGGIYPYIGIVVMICLLMILSSIYGFVFSFSRYLGRKFQISELGLWFNFIALLSLAEWLKATLDTTFAPVLVTDALVGHIGLLQMVSVVGSYGAHIILLFFSTAFYFVYVGFVKKHDYYFFLPFIMVSIIISFLFWGHVRLAKVPTSINVTQNKDISDAINIRMVQYNIVQHEKWDPKKIQTIWEKLYRLSYLSTDIFPDGLKNVDFLIWPESALPTTHIYKRPYFEVVTDTLMPNNVLLTGQIIKKTKFNAQSTMTYHTNSLVAVNDSKEVIASYDKVQLVPLTELVLFKDLLQSLGLDFILELTGKGLQPGNEAMIINIPSKNTYFIPTICYEMTYPNYFYDASLQKESNAHVFLLNVSNDAWFGGSIGLQRMFEFGRLRAVENGLPYIRVANTGISGIIDAYGRIVKQTQINHDDIIDIKLSKQKVSTFALTVNKYIVFALLFLFGIVNIYRFLLLKRSQ